MGCCAIVVDYAILTCVEVNITLMRKMGEKNVFSTVVYWGTALIYLQSGAEGICKIYL